MVIRLLATTILTVVLTGIASADVIVRVQVLEEKGDAAVVTPPVGSPANPQPGDAVITLETLADARGSFLARTSLGKQVIELKGSVTQLGSDRRRVRIDFSDTAEGRAQQVGTNIEMSLNESREIGRLQAGAGWRKIVVTITEQPAK